MGNGSVATQKSTTFEQIIKYYKIIGKNEQYSVMQQQQTGAYIELWSMKFTDQKEFEKQDRLFSKIRHKNSATLLQIIAINSDKLDSFCSTTYELQLLVEHPIQSLGDYLVNRGPKDYTEAEIWHLFDCIVQAQISLEVKEYLNFENIFQCEGDVWKIRGFIPSQSFIIQYHANQSLPVENSYPYVYPAPEELNNKLEARNREKATIFSLGMLILHIAQASSCESLYNNYQLDSIKLKQRIQLLSKSFSIDILTLFNNILQIDEFQRFDYLQVQAVIKSGNHSKPQSQMKFNQESTSKFNEQIAVGFSTQSPNFNLQDLQKDKFTFNQVTPPPQGLTQIQQDANPFNKISMSKNLSFNPESALMQPSQQQAGFKLSQLSNHISYLYNTQRVNGDPLVVKSGENRIELPGGGHYEGEIHNNQMHGKGKLFYDNGNLQYEGEFMDGKFYNFGIQFNKQPDQLNEAFNYQDFTTLRNSWVKYEGDFLNHLRDGIGQLLLSNNEKYVGGFKNDQVHGYGAYTQLNGKVIHGYWDNSKLNKIT